MIKAVTGMVFSAECGIRTPHDDPGPDIEGARRANRRAIQVLGSQPCAMDWIETASEPRVAKSMFWAGAAVRR